MTAQNYLETRERHPASLGVALAIHGVALAALLLAKPELIPLPPGAIELINPTIKVPPKPVEVEPDRPKARTTAIDRPQPRIATDVTQTPDNFVRDPIVFDDIITPGEGIRIEPIERIAEPVIVGPRPDPRFAADAQPPYPPGMQRMEIEGKVTVRVLVGTNGRALRIEPVSADQEAFLKATRDWGLRRWRFTPGTRDGVPVEAWRVMTVRFEIGR